ncbi:MAG: cobalamin biosynthesis protein CbiD [Oscillospiraceae bacterium]|nr:cobalamin biosynthesis protein CbiD [Oscillospiraceae bacterium]
MEQYIYQGTRKLRRGYTTGTCAAAAAGAAARMLLTGTAVPEISVRLPNGESLTLPVTDARGSETEASCAVVKDSGDDPDVTNGVAVYARVSRIPEGVTITGGVGIGIVTKAGLDQPVGAYAINSVPRRMIEAAVRSAAQALDADGGFAVEIYVPEGAELAKKTYNPRMGIEGGISIIGTSGIVEPMSTAALIDTIRTEASMRKAAGEQTLLLTLGNYGEQFLARNLESLSGREVKCSNFLGDAIDIGVAMGFSGILIVGHIGKLVKLGSGIFNTHSSYADGRMETLIACGALAGVETAVLRQIPDCVTVDAALDILQTHGCRDAVLSVLTQRIGHYLDARVKGAVRIGAAVFSYQHDIWLETREASGLLEILQR